MYFEPIDGKSRTFKSLVSLSFHGGTHIELSEPAFFSPGVLPSLRRLLINREEDDEGPISSDTDLDGIASQLRHVSFELAWEDFDGLLDKCTNLLSLAIAAHDIVPSTRRLSKPPVGLRLWSRFEDEHSYEVMEMLEAALSSGLISGSADSCTVIFLAGVDEDDASEAGLSEWAESVGLALEYKDGALQQGWTSVGLDYGYSEFTRWVDEEAAKREAVAEVRRIQAVV